MHVADRATQIRDLMQGPTTEDGLDEELGLLECLISKGLGDATLPGVHQAGRVWCVDGLPGHASEEHEARLWAIQHVAHSADVDWLNQNLDGLDEPDETPSGPGM